ncbi:galactoside alpha-(1,2)-fucosyltransferase 1-like [Saccostrea echinata]|uniref:galactoside alpha-(1,2)-fucosyltransferase 1-like n=1 Tax=Saccostrea echinata TaxID=191078 RepID=UPI002A7EB8C2|nr:galactoside alpha-(1,2)-fucosyltransferase 1-like [Saccostrea echinata]
MNRCCWSLTPVWKKCWTFFVPVCAFTIMVYIVGFNYFTSKRMYDLKERISNGDVSENYRFEPPDAMNITTEHTPTQQHPLFINNTENTGAFRNSHIMISTGVGRLGNRMFEFASLLGISKRHNYKPMILRRNTLLQVFDISQVTDSEPLNLKGVGEKGAGVYDKSLENLSHDKNYSLGGFYQSWKYFDFMKDEVKKSFKFKSGLLNKVRQLQTSLNIGDKITVGVHVRRGDMGSKRELSRGYNVATKEYFDKAFQYFRGKFKNLVFLVVSAEMSWCKSNMKGDDIKFVTTGSAGGDMALLAHCNHSIVSTGSFGWWGAYLAGGEVVYYRNFPSSGSWLSKQYNRTEYYPLHWVGME